MDSATFKRLEKVAAPRLPAFKGAVPKAVYAMMPGLGKAEARSGRIPATSMAALDPTRTAAWLGGRGVGSNPYTTLMDIKAEKGAFHDGLHYRHIMNQMNGSKGAADPRYLSNVLPSHLWPELAQGAVVYPTWLEELRNISYGKQNLSKIREAADERVKASGLPEANIEAILKSNSMSPEMLRLKIDQSMLPGDVKGSYNSHSSLISLSPDADIRTLLHEGQHANTDRWMLQELDDHLVGTMRLRPGSMEDASVGSDMLGKGLLPNNEVYSIIPELKSAVASTYGHKAAIDGERVGGFIEEMAGKQRWLGLGYWKLLRDNPEARKRLMEIYPYIVGAAAAPAAVGAMQQQPKQQR